jgi:hypothetical protein
MNIAEIRKEYPQYAEIPDEKLARGFYDKFYADRLSYDEFTKKIGLSAKPPEKEYGLYTEAAGGPVEAAASLVSGAGASVAGGLAGLAQGAKNLVSPGMPAGDRVKQVQEAMTYQPRTKTGQQTAGAIAYPFEKLAEGADYVGGAVTDVTGSPALGAAANTTLQSIPQLIARGFKAPVANAVAKGETKAAATASRNSVRDTTLATARDEGYVVPPSAANQGGGVVTNRLESVAGKAALNQEASLKNQQITNKIARREAGIAEDSPLSEKTLADAREVIAEPYRQVSALSKEASTALEKLKEVRADAKDYWKHYDIGGDPKSKKAAVALDKRADALEATIDRVAIEKGNPQLLADLKEARKALAKNYDVERALNIGTGDIDAAVIGRILDKRGETGMTGGLQTIGKFAQAFPSFSRQSAKVPTPGVSKSEALAATAFGIGGHAAMGPGGVALAALPLLSEPARALALSKTMQKPRQYKTGMALRLSDLATQSPNMNALTPSLGNRAEE